MSHPIQKALNYIEAHLFEDIALSELAKESSYSLSHFHYVFRVVVGDSVKNYIRYRRMSEAVLELKENDVSIVDLAMKYGYQSREAFSRAFVSVYGKNPSLVKDDDFVYTIRKPFTIVDDFIDYPYTIQSLDIQFEEIKSYYIENSVNPKSVIPHFINDFMLNYHDDEFYGILDFKTNKYRMYKSRGTGQKHDYLVFKLEDDVIENVQKTITYVYRNLMKDSKYEHADASDLEYYTYKNNKLRAILYIPIKSKKNDI